MARTLLYERILDEARLAVIEDGRLAEICIRRPDTENLTGNLYLGRVENVLPGMNAAFVNIGMEKNGFLAAGDIGVDVHGDPALRDALGPARIEKRVRPGQSVLVQVVKSQPGGKGPRLSSHITLPGRLLALLPDVKYVGVSRKLGEETRARLHGLGSALLGESGAGLILRTAAGDADEAAIRAEYDRLRALWRDLELRARHGVAPRLLYDDNAPALRAVRDWLGESTEALWADGEACWQELRDLARVLAPEHLDRIRLHDSPTPLFDLYRVDAQLDKALRKYVWLDGGGSLVIEETEALTVVDVNTAKNVGKKSAEETVFRNNLEAAEEIMRQLRLRDIGGIVVVDFIDMASAEHREALLSALRACAAKDRVRVNVVGLTGLGLVELTRKKERQSLSRQLTRPCAACDGNGAAPSHETTARRIVRDIARRRRQGDHSPLLIQAAPPVCAHLSRIGAPGDGTVYVHLLEAMGAGEYAVSCANPSKLPQGAKKLKRG